MIRNMIWQIVWLTLFVGLCAFITWGTSPEYWGNDWRFIAVAAWFFGAIIVGIATDKP